MLIETRRLVLRKVDPLDAPLLAELYGDPKVQEFIPVGRAVTEESERDVISRHVQNAWEKHGSGLFVVFRKEDSEFVGVCGHLFWEIDGTEEIEVAYAILPKFWRQGYASEAAQVMRDDAFRRLGRERVISLVMPGNVGSAKVAENNGMQIEKQTVLRDKYHVNVWAVQRPAPL